MTDDVEPNELIYWNTFAEEFVIQHVFDSSLEFRAFYEEERPKLDVPILWARDLSLPQGIDFRSTRLSKEVRVIRLRRVPAVERDAARIAQQLEQFVLDSEGFPATGALKQYESLSSALNSMIRGPLVIRRLTAYGFDFRPLHQQRTREAVSELSTVPTPTLHLDTTLWMFNYVGRLLEWEVISTPSDDVVGDFQSWFDYRFPTIASNGQELFAFVKSGGTDTPAKQAILFRKIIANYGLGEIVFS